jgi:hypothetical protein
MQMCYQGVYLANNKVKKVVFSSDEKLACILILSGIKGFKKSSIEGMRNMKICDQSIKKTFKLVDDMLELADERDAVREDTGCGVLYGVVKDSAFKIRKLAEVEKQAHIKKGWWQEQGR